MEPYDLVTVVFEEEIELLALQARSIDLFGRRLSIGRIHIIVNGPAQDAIVERISSEVLPLYGSRGGQVQITPARDIAPCSETGNGWHTQQVLKIAVAGQIAARHYVTLDAKNHLVRPVDDSVFFCEDGRPWFHPSSMRQNMTDYFMNSARICGIDGDACIDWAFPTITPAVLYREAALDLLRFIAESKFGSLEALICASGIKVTEYMLYYSFLVRMNKFNELYRPGPRMVVTLWTTHVQDHRQFEALMGEAEINVAPFFSVHREARDLLTQQQRQRIVAFWQRLGLAGSSRQAEYFLCQPQLPAGGRLAMLAIRLGFMPPTRRLPQ